MGRKLDLRPLIEDTLDIILSEDVTIRLSKPSEALILRLGDEMGFFEGITGENEPAASAAGGEDRTKERIEALNKLTADVLSNNADKKNYTQEWVKKNLPLDVKIAILEAYSEFAMSLGNNPNSAARPSQEEAGGLTPSLS